MNYTKHKKEINLLCLHERPTMVVIAEFFSSKHIAQSSPIKTKRLLIRGKYIDIYIFEIDY